MNTWLQGDGEAEWPQTPEVSLRINESGTTKLLISPDCAQTVTRIEAYYALRNLHAASITSFCKLVYISSFPICHSFAFLIAHSAFEEPF